MMRAGIVFLAVLAMVGGLTGCAAQPNTAEGLLPTPFVIPFGDGFAEMSSDVPAGFPIDIPLIEGEFVRGLTAEDDSGTVYMVAIDSGVEGAAEIVKTQMLDAGFVVSTIPAPPNGVVYDANDWTVSVISGAEGAPESTVLYLATLADTKQS